MEIEFDPRKDQVNQNQHGISLAQAKSFEWDTALIAADTRKVYNEERHVAHGFIAGRLYCLVFTVRGDALRVISLRKANQREVNSYEQAR